MAPRSGVPITRTLQKVILELFKDSRSVRDKSTIEDSLDLDISDNDWHWIQNNIQPTIVADPRFLGYSFLSYIFINTQGQTFDLFREYDERFEKPLNNLMIGSVLGDKDVIIRRIDESKLQHAAFTQNIMKNPDIEFFHSSETYPISRICRWHGKNIREDRQSLNYQPDPPTVRELEVFKRVAADPTKSTSQLYDDIQHDAETNPEYLFINDFDDLTVSEIQNIIQKLEEEALLGYSIIFEHELHNLHHALMGIALGSDQKYDELFSRLTEKFDGFQMPYITSGVGQPWGDILVELYFDSIQKINDISVQIRELGAVSTRAYLLTQTNFSRPL